MTLDLTDPAWKIEPRRWQAEAYTAIQEHYAASDSSPGVVAAVMGSGKSLVISEVAAGAAGRVVVLTPTIRLVDQLHDDLAERLDEPVGRYYTHKKEVEERVIICCTPSAGKLTEELGQATIALAIADEAHRTEADVIRGAIEALKPVNMVGFTATPYRASEYESLSLFDKILYSYSPIQAMEDGVIVPWDVVSWTGEQKSLNEACYEMIKDTKHPGLINAITIADAEFYAEYLNERGFAADSIHSRLSQPERRDRLERLESGELRALVHVSMLKEGVNLPWLHWLALRRPTVSRVRFVQESGRVLRSYPGKTKATIFDPLDVCSQFSMTYAAALGWDEPEPVLDIVAESEEEVEGGIRIDETVMAVHLSEGESKIKALLSLLNQIQYVTGIWPSGKWRDRPLTTAQERMARRLRRSLGAVREADYDLLVEMSSSSCLERLTRGGASDLISIMKEVDERGVWPLRMLRIARGQPVDDLPPPPPKPEAHDVHEVITEPPPRPEVRIQAHGMTMRFRGGMPKFPLPVGEYPRTVLHPVVVGVPGTGPAPIPVQPCGGWTASGREVGLIRYRSLSADYSTVTLRTESGDEVQCMVAAPKYAIALWLADGSGDLDEEHVQAFETGVIGKPKKAALPDCFGAFLNAPKCQVCVEQLDCVQQSPSSRPKGV